jgi:hypothetical protein
MKHFLVTLYPTGERTIKVVQKPRRKKTPIRWLTTYLFWFNFIPQSTIRNPQFYVSRSRN